MNKPKALERAEKHFARKLNPKTVESGWPDKHLEKDVKKFVNEIILEMDPDADIFMPVQSGYGKVDLDFIVGIRGYYLAIETKVNGKKPTHRQLQTIEKKVRAGCVVLIINQNNLADLVEVVEWIWSTEPSQALLLAAKSRKRYLAR